MNMRGLVASKMPAWRNRTWHKGPGKPALGNPMLFSSHGVEASSLWQPIKDQRASSGEIIGLISDHAPGGSSILKSSSTIRFRSVNIPTSRVFSTNDFIDSSMSIPHSLFLMAVRRVAGASYPNLSFPVATILTGAFFVSVHILVLGYA